MDSNSLLPDDEVGKMILSAVHHHPSPLTRQDPVLFSEQQLAFAFLKSRYQYVPGIPVVKNCGQLYDLFVKIQKMTEDPVWWWVYDYAEHHFPNDNKIGADLYEQAWRILFYTAQSQFNVEVEPFHNLNAGSRGIEHFYILLKDAIRK